MGKELIGSFPYKLRNFTISGKALHGLSLNNVFQVGTDIQSERVY